MRGVFRVVRTVVTLPFVLVRVWILARRALKRRREAVSNVQLLPIAEFVTQCLGWLNDSGGAWRAQARPPLPPGESLPFELPAELKEFYSYCDGFAASGGDFPARISSVRDLRLGRDHSPRLSAMLRQSWEEDGNDSEQPGMMAVFPPDDLIAVMRNAYERVIPADALDAMVPLFPPSEGDFVVMAVTHTEGFPAGTILEVEGGSATRHDSFRAWLASYASLFSSVPSMLPKA